MLLMSLGSMLTALLAPSNSNDIALDASSVHLVQRSLGLCPIGKLHEATVSIIGRYLDGDDGSVYREGVSQNVLVRCVAVQVAHVDCRVATVIR